MTGTIGTFGPTFPHSLCESLYSLHTMTHCFLTGCISQASAKPTPTMPPGKHRLAVRPRGWVPQREAEDQWQSCQDSHPSLGPSFTEFSQQLWELGFASRGLSDLHRDANNLVKVTQLTNGSALVKA